MSAITETNSTRAGARPAGAGIVVATDRSGSFQEARRHSQLVRTLRKALPAFGGFLVLLYLGALLRTAGFTAGLEGLPVPRITAQDLTMQNPHYEGATADGGTYRVAAARARQDFNKPDVIELEDITGALTNSDKTTTNLSAVRGTFNHKQSVLVLEEKIGVSSTNGFTAQLTKATVQTKEGLITSDQPVDVGFPAGTIRSKELTIRQKVSEITFAGDVTARLTPPARAQTQPETAQGSNASPSMFGASDGPVDITSARLDIKDAQKTAVFSTDVVAAQTGSRLETPEMTVFYDGEVKPSAGAAKGGGDDAGKVKRILAKGPFVMTRGTTDRVTGQSASFDPQAGTGVLEGNIVMTSLPDRRVTADRVDLDQTADNALLTGTVVVTNGETVLKGRRLFVDRKAGRTSLTAPPMNGNGPGRITSHFVQKKGGAAKKPAAASEANGNSSAIANFKTDPNAPLDIEADSLDVDDTQKVAIFRGDVAAKQGEVTIQSSELKAFYSGSGGLADVATDSKSEETASAAQPQKASAELMRIEADGKVAVTTADGRKVTGDWAKFDATANKIVVGGDVELSQGSSVVSGTRLVIDMVTGRSMIDTAPVRTTAAPASEGKTGVRPNAIFFPKELRKGGAETGGTAGPAKRDATSVGQDGWSATTAPTP